MYIHLRNLIILLCQNNVHPSKEYYRLNFVKNDLHQFKESYHFCFFKMTYIHLRNLIILTSSGMIHIH